MAKTLKKVTANIPADVLARAMELTGQGITPTLITGLRELDRKQHRAALRNLRGKVRFELDLQKTRR
jgi:hypothetical protein